MAAVAGPTQEGCGLITKVKHDLPPILKDHNHQLIESIRFIVNQPEPTKSNIYEQPC